ncbi:MAG: glycosyltransferase family 4 protein [Arenicellales bacterium]
MRVVLYNVTTGWKRGGIETFNMEMGRALSRLGHDVVIVTGSTGVEERPMQEAPSICARPFKRREAFPDFRRIHPAGGSALRKYLERRSFAANALSAVIDYQPDVVVISKPYDFGFMEKLKRRSPSTVVVFCSGGKDFFVTDLFHRKAVDVWVACSQYNAEQIRSRYGVTPTIIPYGVDLEIFKPGEKDKEFRARHGIGQEDFLLVAVGRLVGWKGFQVVVEALEDLPYGHLVIVGGGGYRGTLEEQAATLGVGSRVHFMGDVQHESTPYFYRQADVYVHPSIGQEAFGISLLEAMACGIPVLGSDRGAIPSVLDGAGLIAKARDPGDWAAKIASLRDDPGRLAAMADSGLARVKGSYSWQAGAERLVELARGAIR